MAMDLAAGECAVERCPDRGGPPPGGGCLHRLLTEVDPLAARRREIAAQGPCLRELSMSRSSRDWGANPVD